MGKMSGSEESVKDCKSRESLEKDKGTGGKT